MHDSGPLTLIIPEHILKPILVTAECIRLNKSILEPLSATANCRKRKLVHALEIHQALELLTETCKSPIGRHDLAGIKILPIIINLTRFLISSSSRNLLYLSLKLLINLCNGEILNQDCFLEEDGIDVVARVFDSVSFKTDIETTVYGLQLLGNLCPEGEEHRAAVWCRFFPVVFKDISRVRVREIADVLCMVLYACCDGSNALIGQLCGAQGLQILAEILTTASTDKGEDEFLVELLAKVCLGGSYFWPLLSELSIPAGALEKTDSLSAAEKTFTPVNSYLLKTLYEYLFKKRHETVFLSKDFAVSILGLLKRVVRAVDFLSRDESHLPTYSPTVNVLGYTISIIMIICIRSEDAVVDLLLSSGLVNIFLGLLRELEQPEIIKKYNRQDLTGVEQKVCPYKGFRRDLVGVIGNCLHERKHVQDEIRHKNGILLLLQQGVEDTENPGLRSFGNVAVNNLLYKNRENQQVVEKLRKGTAFVPALVELRKGVVAVNSLTGRPTLVSHQ
ncbi:uncharacterized protein LOC113335883 [Papaver somniferum]|uniref:uncharacterized protein LOC113335883 n=1 Tax=Papaver somniferum TaxID=3469 RepID=UPI000E6F4FE5|nr:uncharacterized protein LOC113335883 [Papaver somniferum]